MLPHKLPGIVVGLLVLTERRHISRQLLQAGEDLRQTAGGGGVGRTGQPRLLSLTGRQLGTHVAVGQGGGGCLTTVSVQRAEGGAAGLAGWAGDGAVQQVVVSMKQVVQCGGADQAADLALDHPAPRRAQQLVQGDGEVPVEPGRLEQLVQAGLPQLEVVQQGGEVGVAAGAGG